jgi:hypothetical protein
MITLAAINTAGISTEYAVGWFTLALINAGLAQAKGRSGLAWWLWSLLLGPVATFLVVALDRVTPAAP